MFNHLADGNTPQNLSPFTKTTYYERGPTAEFRNVLQTGQDIENMLSKEEIYKIQNALLEAKP